MRSHFIKSKTNALKVAVSGILLTLAMPFSAFAMTSTVYDATPSPLPPNVVSLGYEATSTSQFGDYVHLASGDRNLNSVTVTMSDWAIYSDYANDPRYSGNNVSWTHPITINIYGSHLGANGVPDQLLASKTQTVTIPWRPAADPTCPVSTAWRASDNNCYNGKAFNATVNMSDLAVTLPDDVIVGVAFNTADYGANPLHQAGPYNSLNVGIPDGQLPSVGTDDSIFNVFWDSTYPGQTPGFREDTGWAPNGTVALKVMTGTASPTSKDQCKNNGWQAFGNFKNQGDCVSFVATKGKNAPSY